MPFPFPGGMPLAFASRIPVQVAFGAAGAGAFSVGAGAVSPAYPSGIVAGMGLILHVGADDAGTVSITTPTGWTPIATASPASTKKFAAFFKQADGTESGTLAVTLTDSNIGVARLHRTTDYCSGFEANAQNSSAASSTTCSNVNVTTTQALEMAIQLYGWTGAVTTIGNSSGESGADYTEAVSVYSVSGAGLDIQTATVATATAITSGSATLGAARVNHGNIGFALLP